MMNQMNTSYENNRIFQLAIKMQLCPFSVNQDI